MDRDILQAAMYGAAALAVLGVGAWLFIAGGPEPTDDAPDSPTASAEDEADTAPNRHQSGTFDVPRCPLAIRLGPSFRSKETERDPNLRVQSPDRALRVDIACRRSDRDFAPGQFLDETLRAVRARHDGNLQGTRRFESGPARGWSAWRRQGRERRYYMVLVRGRTVFNIDLYGPASEKTKAFARELVETKLRWPGAESDSNGRDGGAADSSD